MSTHQKAYRYRLRPTPEQEAVFVRWAGARRWVYNHFLARRKEHSRETGKTLSYNTLARELTALKRQPETAWLLEMNAQSLQQALRDLDKAFGNFFGKRAGFPRFRSKKHDRPTFRLPAEVRVEGEQLYVPKVGLVRLVLHRPVAGTVKSATFTQDATGAWYVSLVTHFALPDVAPPPPARERTVGVDLGLKDLAVLSDGERVPTPKHARRAERKLARLQRKLARCQRGSTNREQARAAFAALGQPLNVADCTLNLGIAAFYSGLFELALAAWRQAEAVYAASDARGMALVGRRNQAEALFRLGQLETAAAQLVALVPVAEEQDARGDLGEILHVLGEVRHAQGEAAQAREALERAEALFDALTQASSGSALGVPYVWASLCATGAGV